MSLTEILEEIQLVRGKMLITSPTSIEFSDLTVALICLQDLAIKALMAETQKEVA